MKLPSATAIVTGASRGLGSAIAAALIEKGAEVYGVSRDLDALHERQKKLGQNFAPVALDITDQGAIEEWIGQTFARGNAPDILVNNAGAGIFGAVDALPVERWEQMIEVNISGVFYLTRSLMPLMKDKKTSSHIINIGSILGTMGNPEMSAYCATKFGINGFSEALFKELRYEGIKVSCVNPGSIETDFFAESGIESHGNMLQPEDLANTVINLLKTPDNMLISDMTIRPLNPKKLGSK
ncbi:SDR family oxidoreductase [Fodinibius halophilus]|uniref:SDR family NAD(P)-dependent oxidoreductase n=1 Tax=Fodinibius halophilus TaxID=1736908 RepID=A0A6M1SYN6_9BACT|nr:SDR family NAD(P)-dependent oxidoreductase [Fodinibius halophilus]NGP86719.1 SDR family NAD(P)-dependent oxidoreductase [Fodinibius halophilus]